jgi:hypothetical protein
MPAMEAIATSTVPVRLRSVFSPSTSRERAENFEAYWAYMRRRDGEILETEKNLTRKKEILAEFQANPVRSRKPLPDPERFYRNYVKLVEDPASFDPKTRLLTFLYKFARHEWAGISCAWDATPSITLATRTTQRISRYHLCEEFSHIRLFHEMFRTFHLDRVEWVPPGNGMRRMYAVFSRFPGVLMNPPAFVSELMGLTLYLHIDAVLNEILADEPEARDRVRALLREIMTDELGHVGQRRNFIGAVGIKASYAMVGPMFRAFYRDLPEARHIFDIEQMVREAKAFDYRTMPQDVLAAAWAPSYCRS